MKHQHPKDLTSAKGFLNKEYGKKMESIRWQVSWPLLSNVQVNKFTDNMREEQKQKYALPVMKFFKMLNSLKHNNRSTINDEELDSL